MIEQPERRLSTSSYDPSLIRVRGAREHNLRGVDLEIRKNRLICFTGVSGSGKSSFAFDTLFAEGQRRYVESLSSYARQFIGQLPKPDVDQISGLAPSISIQQKTSGWNPRSTVGTITQILDYLRVLLARAGTQHCPRCGKPISAQTREQMIARALSLPVDTRVLVLAPKIRGQKGEYRDLFDELVRLGYARARVDGAVIDLASPPTLDRYRRHDIDVVIDRLVIKESVRSRLAEAIDLAISLGGGTAILAPVDASDARIAEEGEPQSATRSGRARSEKTPTSDIVLSSSFACTACGIGFEPPTPQMFSFNSPQGMCVDCDGLGTRYEFIPELLVPNPKLNFLSPCIAPYRTKPGKWRRHLYEGVARHVGFDLKTAWEELSEEARHALLFGTGETQLTFEWRGRFGVWKHGGTWEGVIPELLGRYRKAESAIVRTYYEQFMRNSLCRTCGGGRLTPQSLAMRLPSTYTGDLTWLNIMEIGQLPIRTALAFFSTLALDGVRKIVAEEPLKEIRARLEFLLEVGLDYLALDRSAPTLSGGESQRIRLASQIGCGLVGVLYVLDEPSIGLHPRDNKRLLNSLKRLRDMGNTVIVVEHDRETMEAADEIVDFGPGPGVRGGAVVAQGGVADIAAVEESVTGAYLSGRRRIEIPASRRPIDAAPIDRSVKKTSAADEAKTASEKTRRPKKSTSVRTAPDTDR